MWIMNQKLLKRKTKDNEPKETTTTKKKTNLTCITPVSMASIDNHNKLVPTFCY